MHGMTMNRYGHGYGYAYGGRLSRRAIPPAQVLVNAFAGTGLLDALLLFDPAHYSTPGSTPGVLADALGGPITYTAPNTQATPAVVLDSSGYSYADADGVDDTLIASGNQTVACYTAVFRSSPGRTVWSGYGGLMDNTVSSGQRLGNFSPAADAANGTGYDPSGLPRAVRRDGIALTNSFSLAPITDWQVITVFTQSPTTLLPLQLFAIYESAFVAVHLAALGIRYMDPTPNQVTTIESLFTPIQQALLTSS